MLELIFLGTGGGRFATIYQARSTGGLYLKGSKNIHIDPGPTAVHQMKQVNLDPTKTDVIMISHCHPDHYTDAEVLIEGMTEGTTKKRGILVGSKSVMQGYEGIGPAVSAYHQGAVSKSMTAEVGDSYDFGDIKVKATFSKHTDPSSVGFRFTTDQGDISYISDTDLTQKVINAHKGSRLLIMSTTRPLYSKIPFHLSTEDAAYIVDHIKPEVAILTHFGLKSIKEGTKLQSEWVTKKTGIKCVAGSDLMTVKIGKKISIHPFQRSNHRNGNRSSRNRRNNRNR